MTESQWLECNDPRKMLRFVRGDERNRLPERRSRLFGVACCCQLWSLLVDKRSRDAIDVAERYSDGLATAIEPATAYDAAFDVTAEYAEHPERRHSRRIEALGRAANAVAGACHPDELAEGLANEAMTAAHAADMPDEGAIMAAIVRDLFGNPFQPVAFAQQWRTNTAFSLASRMYESRSFSAMPILADALQEAGCENEDVLNHCRGHGPHVRGCWVVDLVLGKN
jgi:hypothetical protein